jgi:hypothetical protein
MYPARCSLHHDASLKQHQVVANMAHPCIACAMRAVPACTRIPVAALHRSSMSSCVRSSSVARILSSVSVSGCVSVRLQQRVKDRHQFESKKQPHADYRELVIRAC